MNARPAAAHATPAAAAVGFETTGAAGLVVSSSPPCLIDNATVTWVLSPTPSQITR